MSGRGRIAAAMVLGVLAAGLAGCAPPASRDPLHGPASSRTRLLTAPFDLAAPPPPWRREGPADGLDWRVVDGMRALAVAAGDRPAVLSARLDRNPLSHPYLSLNWRSGGPMPAWPIVRLRGADGTVRHLVLPLGHAGIALPSPGPRRAARRLARIGSGGIWRRETFDLLLSIETFLPALDPATARIEMLHLRIPARDELSGRDAPHGHLGHISLSR